MNSNEIQVGPSLKIKNIDQIFKERKDKIKVSYGKGWQEFSLPFHLQNSSTSKRTPGRPRKEVKTVVSSLRIKEEDLDFLEELKGKEEKSLSELFSEFLQENKKEQLRDKAHNLIKAVVTYKAEKNKKKSLSEILQQGGESHSIGMFSLKNYETAKEGITRHYRESAETLPEFVIILRFRHETIEKAIENYAYQLYTLWTYLEDEKKDDFIQKIFQTEFYVHSREIESTDYSVYEFRENEKEYKKWIQLNPNAFVLTIPKVPSNKMTLHQVNCASVNSLSKKEHMKVCAYTVGDLKVWAIDHGRNKKMINECPQCHSLIESQNF